MQCSGRFSDALSVRGHEKRAPQFNTTALQHLTARPWFSFEIVLTWKKHFARSPTFLGNEYTSQIMFWAKPKSKCIFFKYVIQFLTFHFVSGDVSPSHHNRYICSGLNGFCFEPIGNRLKNRVRLVDQDLAFLGCPPTVGGHVRRSIFGSGKWTPNWVHGTVGCGGVALNRVPWVWNGERSELVGRSINAGERSELVIRSTDVCERSELVGRNTNAGERSELVLVHGEPRLIFVCINNFTSWLFFFKVGTRQC